MYKIQVNIFPNNSNKKPTTEEAKIIQYNICKAENAKTLDFHEFVSLVGERGYSFKSSFLVGGAKNDNFSAAFMLVLDFDNGTTIENFLNTSKGMGLEPTAIYKSFSYAEELQKFRAIWKLSKPIEDPKVKTVLQLMLMEAFSYCDKNCKDLARLYYGGKGIVHYNEASTLSVRNLLVAVLTKIDHPNHGKKNRRNLCKKLGLNMIDGNFPAIIKKDVNKVEKRHFLNNIYIEDVTDFHPNETIYDGYIFFFSDNYKQDRS